MDEGSVRRVHQADHRMVDGTRHAHGFVKIRAALAELGDGRDLGRGVHRRVAEEHPDIALHLVRRIGLDPDAADFELLARA